MDRSLVLPTYRGEQRHGARGTPVMTGSTAAVLQEFHMLNRNTRELPTVEDCEAEAQLFAQLTTRGRCGARRQAEPVLCNVLRNKNSVLCRFSFYRDVEANMDKNTMVTSKTFIHNGMRLVLTPQVIQETRRWTNAYFVMGSRLNYDYESIDRVRLADHDVFLVLHPYCRRHRRGRHGSGKRPQGSEVEHSRPGDERN